LGAQVACVWLLNCIGIILIKPPCQPLDPGRVARRLLNAVCQGRGPPGTSGTSGTYENTRTSESTRPDLWEHPGLWEHPDLWAACPTHHPASSGRCGPPPSMAFAARPRTHCQVVSRLELLELLKLLKLLELSGTFWNFLELLELLELSGTSGTFWNSTDLLELLELSGTFWNFWNFWSLGGNGSVAKQGKQPDLANPLCPHTLDKPHRSE